MPELSSNLHHLTKPAYHTAPFPTLKNLNLIQLLASICILILSVIVLEENITSYIGNRILYDFGVHTAFGIPMPWKHALPAFSEHDPFYYLRFPHWKFARSFSFVAFFGAIGIISAGHALLLAIRMFLARGRKVNGRASALAKFGLYTTALSFILSFVAVIYGWHGAGTTFTTEEVRNNSYNDTSGSHGYSGPLVMWRATTGPVAALDDFTWNCALVAPVWNGLESISNEFLPAVYMDFWCHKTRTLLALTIPILFLCAAMFGIEIWSLYRGRKVSEIQPNFIKMPDDPPGEGDHVPLHGLATPSQVWRRGGPGYPEGRDPEIMPH